MAWITIILTLFGPAIGEIIKRILLKILPDLPAAERRAARKEIRAIAKRAVRKDKAVSCGYAAVCSPETVQIELEKLEARLAVRVSEIKGAASP